MLRYIRYLSRQITIAIFGLFLLSFRSVEYTVAQQYWCRCVTIAGLRARMRVKTPAMSVRRLDRAHLTVGRAHEYFDANELEKQTGQPRSRFAGMAIKESVDNALDVCETAGVGPEITIEAAQRGGELALTVTDNGPGLAPEIVHRILDFDTRTSDKLAYRAPTRGLQGNALKT